MAELACPCMGCGIFRATDTYHDPIDGHLDLCEVCYHSMTVDGASWRDCQVAGLELLQWMEAHDGRELED